MSKFGIGVEQLSEFALSRNTSLSEVPLITNLCVEEEVRGKGVGKKSIEFRLKKMKDEDKKKEKEAKKEDSSSNVGEVGGREKGEGEGEGKGKVVVEEVENMDLGGEGVAQ